MDNVLALFPGGSSGLFGSKVYDVVVIPEGLLLVQLTKSITNEAVKKAKEASEERNEGFFKKMASVMSAGSSLLERYNEKTREEILNETPGNLFIPKEALRKLKVSSNTDSSQGNSFDSTVIKIVWNEGKIKLTFRKDLNARKVKHFLKETFGL
ncbi:MAG TPA: hypothetical protein ENN47_09505 [Mesotoga infera]|uniref:Uncharacterized protein n=1 Tax=Mesotoga infera TaxID=1236046 RepID=A0A7C1CW11_9BACT|nr:hypothetical protein [Mesotoga infera]